MAGFVGLVKTSRSNKIKNCSLVTNYLVPAFNKINNKFTKIFPKHDLNKLAQALTNPKIERLIVKMIAILGVIVSIGAGLVTYRKQGGTILGM
jgi:hypothetical protein